MPPVRPLRQLADCTPGVPNLPLGQIGASLVDAAVRLMISGRMGEVIPIKYHMVGTGVGTAGVNSDTGKAQFAIYENNLNVPVLVAMQPILVPSPAPGPASALYLAPTSTWLAVENDGSNEPWVPRAVRKVLSGESFETVLMPGQKIYGVVLGPAGTGNNKYTLPIVVTTLLDALGALEAVQRGLSG